MFNFWERKVYEKFEKFTKTKNSNNRSDYCSWCSYFQKIVKISGQANKEMSEIVSIENVQSARIEPPAQILRRTINSRKLSHNIRKTKESKNKQNEKSQGFYTNL